MTPSPADRTDGIEILMRKRAVKERSKTQKDIVRQHSGLIEELVRDHSATLIEVGDVLRALGEPVRQPGLEATIRQLLGTTKDIRAGRDAPPEGAGRNASPAVTARPDPFEDDDEQAFVARRPRGHTSL